MWVANIAFPRELLESTKLVKFERYAEFTVADLTGYGLRLWATGQRPGRSRSETRKGLNDHNGQMAVRFRRRLRCPELVSFANESEPLPPRLSHLRVSAIEVEPSSVTRRAACDGQGRRSRVPAVLTQALGDLTATGFAAAGSPDGRAWIAARPRTAGRRPPARRHIRGPLALARGPRSGPVGHAGHPARRRPGPRSGPLPGPHRPALRHHPGQRPARAAVGGDRPQGGRGSPRTAGRRTAVDPGRRASRPARHHRPARHDRRERPAGPG